MKAEDDPKYVKELLLHLEVVSESGEERLREGVLLYLTFAIKTEASSGAKVVLAEAGGPATSGGTMKALVEKDGMIEVIQPEEVPYTSCFFFTH